MIAGHRSRTFRAGRAWLVGLVLFPTACQAASREVRVPRGGTDVTFFVAADAHFGAFQGIDALNRLQVEAMNSLPGEAYPPALGEKVATPRGVLFTGDATDHGFHGEWKQFLKCYGPRGAGGLLHWPLYECAGNHDRPIPWLSVVLAGVRARHGALRYSWDWDDLHVVCLDEYPDASGCRWLAADLAKIDQRVPVVLYFHYALLGPFSGPEWWTEKEKEKFRQTIAGYNVVAIFHGHYHGSEHYQWAGYDVYNVGSPCHNDHSFAAVHVTDKVLTVASWDWDAAQWSWRHAKALHAPAANREPQR